MTTSDEDGFELARTDRTLPIALLRAREAVMERFRPILHAHDVTEQQWRILRILQERGEMDATQLARRACILAPSLTRMIQSMEGRGLIGTRRDPEDRRRALIVLTKAGDGLLRKVAPESAAIYAEIEARVGADRLAHLLDEIEALQHALSPRDP